MFRWTSNYGKKFQKILCCRFQEMVVKWWIWIWLHNKLMDVYLTTEIVFKWWIWIWLHNKLMDVYLTTEIVFKWWIWIWLDNKLMDVYLTILMFSISEVYRVATFCSRPTSDTSLMMVSLLALVSSSVLVSAPFRLSSFPFNMAFSCIKSVTWNTETAATLVLGSKIPKTLKW